MGTNWGRSVSSQPRDPNGHPAMNPSHSPGTSQMLFQRSSQSKPPVGSGLLPLAHGRGSPYFSNERVPIPSTATPNCPTPLTPFRARFTAAKENGTSGSHTLFAKDFQDTGLRKTARALAARKKTAESVREEKAIRAVSTYREASAMDFHPLDSKNPRRNTHPIPTDISAQLLGLIEPTRKSPSGTKEMVDPQTSGRERRDGRVRIAPTAKKTNSKTLSNRILRIATSKLSWTKRFMVA